MYSYMFFSGYTYFIMSNKLPYHVKCITQCCTVSLIYVLIKIYMYNKFIRCHTVLCRKECQEQVVQFSGAKYKKFVTREDAQAFIDNVAPSKAGIYVHCYTWLCVLYFKIK